MATYQYLFVFLAITIASSGYFGFKNNKISKNIYAFGFAIVAQFFFLLAIIPIVYANASISKQVIVSGIICAGTIPVQYYAMKFSKNG